MQFRTLYTNNHYPEFRDDIKLFKSRISMAKAAFNKKTLFTSKLDLNLRKKLVKCYIWSMVSYGAETWTPRAADQKYLESFEMWCWRRMEKISWTHHVRNEEVLLRVNGQKNILRRIPDHEKLLRYMTCFGYYWEIRL